ncbi:MAG: type I-E CRISPR-associated protein Cas5/CasD [Planctomycetia bacterium]|nr:type I-E CRISPR-associated protein Cas5/CasD [Planctomycetia bacterium]
MKYLFLWLEAPLQSWGFDSRFDLRATALFPTKSGIYGLLLASSGDSGPQTDLLAQMRDASFLAVDFRKPGDAAPQLRDYHMVGSGYDKNDPWEKLHILKTSEGKPAVGGGAKQTYRYYLQDKKFGVVIAFPDDLADKFATSLQNPVYDLYLGRKCCVPTDFIYRGVFPSEEEACTAMEALAEGKGLVPDRCFRDTDVENPDGFYISDVPVEFGERKRYVDRCVVIEPYVCAGAAKDG